MNLKKSMLIPALLFASSLGLAEVTVQQPEAVTSPVPEEIKVFITSFINGENTVARQLEHFAPTVHYYDRGVVDKSVIERDIQRHIRHWPWRKYRLTQIEYVKNMPDENAVFVSYVVDFEVSNASRLISGTARYGVMLAGLPDQPKIEGIVEKVVKRSAIATLE